MELERSSYMDERKKVLFIVNPVSGKNRSKGQFLNALDQFSKHDLFVETYITQAPMDAYDYLLKYAENYDIVVISGGAGTLNEATNALIQLEKKPLLGYLPSGDHSITTEHDTVRESLEDLLDLLNDKGLVLITFYPGHDEGKKEALELNKYLESLDQKTFTVVKFNFINQINNPPFTIMIQKK